MRKDKKIQKLRISRETLHALEAELNVVAGGSLANTCMIETCVQCQVCTSRGVCSSALC